MGGRTFDEKINKVWLGFMFIGEKAKAFFLYFHDLSSTCRIEPTNMDVLNQM